MSAPAPGEFIARYTGEQTENPDLADQYNTCLKMAVKRANMNAVNNMMGGWGEQFLSEDDDMPEPPAGNPTRMRGMAAWARARRGAPRPASVAPSAVSQRPASRRVGWTLDGRVRWDG